LKYDWREFCKDLLYLAIIPLGTGIVVYRHREKIGRGLKKIKKLLGKEES
jgi:hypothetical protein